MRDGALRESKRVREDTVSASRQKTGNEPILKYSEH